jgi:NAD(P)-dependent dehydrogenase (short-subunit alcohol dehydrogenase family)
MPNPERVWFITGTSSGLGKALVETVLQSGERVVATSRNPSKLSYLSDKYPPSQLLLQPVDITKVESVKAALDKAVEKFGRVDVLVNNAGYALVGEVEGIPLEKAREIFEVQFWGTVITTKEVCFS